MAFSYCMAIEQLYRQEVSSFPFSASISRLPDDITILHWSILPSCYSSKALINSLSSFINLSIFSSLSSIRLFHFSMTKNRLFVIPTVVSAFVGLTTGSRKSIFAALVGVLLYSFFHLRNQKEKKKIFLKDIKYILLCLSSLCLVDKPKYKRNINVCQFSVSILSRK